MTVVSPNLEMQRGPAAAARRVSTGPMALSEYFSLPFFYYSLLLSVVGHLAATQEQKHAQYHHKYPIISSCKLGLSSASVSEEPENPRPPILKAAAVNIGQWQVAVGDRVVVVDRQYVSLLYGVSPGLSWRL